MRARVERSFRDLKAKRIRHEGEEFELTEARFDEVGSKLPGYLTRLPDDKPRAKRRTPSNKAEEPADK